MEFGIDILAMLLQQPLLLHLLMRLQVAEA